MKFDFDASPAGGLKIIRSIPDPNVCLIEGYNGVGKTMSVRLLMLCTGQQPYAHQRLAWSTLRTGLGRARITAEGLNGAASIEWTLDSTTWPETPGDTVDQSWLGKIRVDGEPASLADVRSLLEVNRIAGDVTLAETFARQADDYAADLSSFRARMLDQAGTTHLALDLLAQVESIARRANSITLRAARDAADQATVRARAAADRLAAASARLTLLDDAAVVRGRIALLRDTAPGIETELATVERDLEEADEQRDNLSSALREAETRAAASEDDVRQLRNARRTAERNRDRLAAARDELAETLAAAGLIQVPEDLERCVQERREAIDVLLRRRAEMDAGPLVRELLDDLVDRLTQAADAGLGDQTIIADNTTGIAQTVTELRDALTVRAASLPTDQAAPAAVQSLDHDTARANARLRAAEGLDRVLDAVDRWQRLAEQASDRVADLAAQQSADHTDLNRLQGELREIDETLLDQSTRRVLLRRQLNDLTEGTDKATLVSRLAALLEQAETDEDHFGADRDATAHAVSVAHDEFARERVTERNATTELNEARTDLRRAVTLLHDADEFAYLRRRGIPMPREHDDDQAQAAVLVELLASTVASQSRLQDIPNRLEEMQAALADIAAQLRGNDRRGETYQAELLTWLASRFTGWFRQRTVADVLFPGAEEVRVDLGLQAVVWRPAGGTEQMRPFEAFSSGEQAFAYTRAQLEALGPPQAQNRVTVLDEFGAFVAHNLRDDLRRLLRERSEQSPHEKTIVILPATQDYRQLAGTSVDMVAAQHAARADALEGPEGYFAEEFTL
jgi:hypothetical protein